MKRHGVNTEKLSRGQTVACCLSEQTTKTVKRAPRAAPPCALRCQVWSIWRATSRHLSSNRFRRTSRFDAIAVAISFSSFGTALCFPWSSARVFHCTNCIIHLVHAPLELHQQKCALAERAGSPQQFLPETVERVRRALPKIATLAYRPSVYAPPGG